MDVVLFPRCREGSLSVTISYVAYGLAAAARERFGVLLSSAWAVAVAVEIREYLHSADIGPRPEAERVDLGVACGLVVVLGQKVHKARGRHRAFVYGGALAVDDLGGSGCVANPLLYAVALAEGCCVLLAECTYVGGYRAALDGEVGNGYLRVRIAHLCVKKAVVTACVNVVRHVRECAHHCCPLIGGNVHLALVGSLVADVEIDCDCRRGIYTAAHNEVAARAVEAKVFDAVVGRARIAHAVCLYVWEYRAAALEGDILAEAKKIGVDIGFQR